jgi:hypothetical protein
MEDLPWPARDPGVLVLASRRRRSDGNADFDAPGWRRAVM